MRRILVSAYQIKARAYSERIKLKESIMTDETGVLFEEGYVEDFTKSKANDKSSRNVLFFTPLHKTTT